MHMSHTFLQSGSLYTSENMTMLQNYQIVLHMQGFVEIHMYSKIYLHKDMKILFYKNWHETKNIIGVGSLTRKQQAKFISTKRNSKPQSKDFVGFCTSVIRRRELSKAEGGAS